MTTPNPFYPKRLMEIALHREALVHPQHVSWFCPTTLREIMRRAGYVDIKVTPFNNTERMKFLVDALTGWRPWLSTNLLVQGFRPKT